MSDPVEVKTAKSVSDNSTYIQAKISDVSLITEHMAMAIYRNISEQIAERYVRENYAQIAAKLDQNAIANLAIAEASKKIAEEIQRRPNVVHEVERQIFQRGIFGGLKRVR
jgi:hypothetical protein